MYDSEDIIDNIDIEFIDKDDKKIFIYCVNSSDNMDIFFFI